MAFFVTIMIFRFKKPEMLQVSSEEAIAQFRLSYMYFVTSKVVR